MPYKNRASIMLPYETKARIDQWRGYNTSWTEMLDFLLNYYLEKENLNQSND